MKKHRVGYIYKITCLINNKVYIGQTICTIEDRWIKHQRESIGGKYQLDTKLARALRKYGVDNFKIEIVEQLYECTVKELTAREHYWVHYYNSIEEGYNVQDPLVCHGGNTYAGKTEAELDEIKEKIRQTKLGGKNPRARAIKCLNIETAEVMHFAATEDARRYFNDHVCENTHHQFITRRCRCESKSPYLGKYKFAYEENDFI